MENLLATYHNASLQAKLVAWSVFTITTLVLIRKIADGRPCKEKKDLRGKVAIVTGSNVGVGLETAKALASMGSHVILACRDTKKAAEAVSQIKREVPNNPHVESMVLDLTSFDSIKQFVQDFSKKGLPAVHLLVNNAGVMNTPKSKTKDGYELQFGTNHLGHFLLTRLLMPYLQKGGKDGGCRIVNVSSTAHQFAKPFLMGTQAGVDLDDVYGDKRYSPFFRYAQSKVANILFTIELAKRLDPNSGITTFSLHPGYVKTDLYRNVPPYQRIGLGLIELIFARSPKQGAQTSVWACVSSQLDGKTGLYLDNCKIDSAAKHATDTAVAKKLWEMSSKFVGLPEDL